MVKCMECGKEIQRIQSHHLRSKKCTGVVRSFEEYKLKYPDAILIDPELCKRTTLSLVNFIIKYGEEEGNKRWNLYRERQAVSNTFEYKHNRFGWTKERFDEYNRSRAVTMENLILRHGEQEGLLIWQRYCDRQKYTTTLEYFISQYGEIAGKDKWENFNNIRNMQSVINFEKISSSSKSIIEDKCFNDLIYSIGLIKKYRNRWWHSVGITRRNIDYLDYSSKIAIEFYGDYIHMNPKIYEYDDWNGLCRRSAAQTWEYDLATRCSLESVGIKLHIIWESDWRKTPDLVRKGILAWLQNIN